MASGVTYSIAFSGIPGSGKTTQALMLARSLETRAADVELIDLQAWISRDRSYVSSTLKEVRGPLRMNVDADVVSFSLFDRCLKHLEGRRRGVCVVDPSPGSILAGYRAIGAATEGLEAIARVTWKPSIEVRLDVSTDVASERISLRREPSADWEVPLTGVLLNAWRRELARTGSGFTVVPVDAGGSVADVAAVIWERLSAAGALEMERR